MNKNLVSGILASLTLLLLYFVFPTAGNIQIVVTYPSSRLKVQSLFVRGNNCGLSWTKGYQLNYKGNNIWTYTLTCPQDTFISLKILEGDSNWMIGQNFQFSISIYESAKTVNVFPSFYPSINGIVDTSPIKSTTLNNSRKCSIYYPPSYHDNIYKTYPILLMHDGQNLFEDSKSAFGAWKIQDTLNSLIIQGNIEEIIVVGIWNTNNRNNEYTYSYDSSQKFGGKGDLYLDFIQKELMPVINTTINQRIKGDKWHIGGSSLGGLISCYAIHTRPTVYQKAICMSSSFWWNNEDFQHKILSKWANQTIYIDSGDSGPAQDSLNDTMRVKNKYISLKYTLNDSLFYYLDKGGQHNEKSWGNRFNIPLQLLFA